MRILDFLKQGALVELIGTPYAKAFVQEDGNVKAEIRLNVSKTNILRLRKDDSSEDDDEDLGNEDMDDYTFDDF